MENLHLSSDLAKVHMNAADGRPLTFTANIEQISTSGATLHLEKPLEKGAQLRLECSNCAAICNRRAHVIECLFKAGLGYDCRIVFESGCEWDPKQCQPAHLLDLKRFEAAVSEGCSHRCPNRHVCPREIITRVVDLEISLAKRTRQVASEVASLCGELDDAALASCFQRLFHVESDCRLFAEFRSAYRARRAGLPTAGRARVSTVNKARRLARLIESIPAEALQLRGCSSSSGASANRRSPK